jgi:Family of unknown function (DUF6527)
MKRNAKARLVFAFSELQIPGDFFYEFDRHGAALRICYSCPCGCGVFTALQIARVKLDRSWKWNGNIPKPTLEPSINHVGHWHGYLKDGEFIEC